jgi:hypothetical protein
MVFFLFGFRLGFLHPFKARVIRDVPEKVVQTHNLIFV